MLSSWRSATLVTRTAIVVAVIVNVLIIGSSVLVAHQSGMTPEMFAVRMMTGAIAIVLATVLMARMVARPIARIGSLLRGHGNARAAARAVRAQADGMSSELAAVASGIAALLDQAADRNADLLAQQKQLLATNAAIDAEHRKLLRLERERQASDALLGAVVQALPDALIVVDGNLRLRVWSRSAAAMLGLDGDHAFGHDFLATCIAPASHENVRAGCAATAARFEATALHRGGRELTVELTVTPVATPGGRYHAITVRDLAALQQAEAEARQAQKLEAVGRLASGVAHELNTPIQFIGDSVTFARDGVAELHALLVRYRAVAGELAPPDVKAALADAEEAADLAFLTEQLPPAFERTLDGVDRVATIVRAMKEFAHPESREKSMADLNRALTSTLTVARNEVKYAADVETDLGELPLVPCHLGELNQVFLNLLVNAAHAIQDDPKHAGRKGRIRVVTRTDGDQVVVSVSDDGCGIPESHRAKVYDPFFTTKAVGRGTGQGLAIARTVVVDKHGGSISVDSQVGIGTTFHVRLPVR